MMLAHGMPGVWNSWFRRSQDSDSRVDAVSQLAGPRLRGVIMVRVSLPQESLSKVDFGAPAAERDIERGSADDRCGMPEVHALVRPVRPGRRPHLQSRRPACAD